MGGQKREKAQLFSIISKKVTKDEMQLNATQRNTTFHAIFITGYYCPAGSTSATQIQCGNGQADPVQWFCGSGSASATQVSAGYYTQNADGTFAETALAMRTRALQIQAERGHYAINGLRRSCPAGKYGSTLGLANADCSGNWYVELAPLIRQTFAMPAYFCPLLTLNRQTHRSKVMRASSVRSRRRALRPKTALQMVPRQTKSRATTAPQEQQHASVP